MRNIILTTIVILTAILSSINVNAQVPGYIGKRILLKGNSSFTVRWNKEYWIKYGGSAEYVISKRFSIGVSYLLNKSTIATPERHDDFFRYPNFTLKTHSFSIDIYKYSHIAPLGNFVKFSPFFMYNYSPDYYISDIPLNSNIDIYSAPKYNEDYMSNTNWGFTVFFGRRRIVKDIISISYGLKFGLTWINPVTAEIISDRNNNDSPFYSSDNSTMNDTYNYTAYDNFFSTFLSFDVNIGFVL